MTDDSEPDLIALHDQLAADARQKARVVAAYLRALGVEGVDGYDALQLALAFQRRLIFGDGEEPEGEDED